MNFKLYKRNATAIFDYSNSSDVVIMHDYCSKITKAVTKSKPESPLL